MKTYGLDDALHACLRVTLEIAIVAAALVAAVAAYAYITVTGRDPWTG